MCRVKEERPRGDQSQSREMGGQMAPSLHLAVWGMVTTDGQLPAMARV